MPKAETSNTALWDAVSKTDPKYTKKVNQRGGFTAIAAHSQVLAATKQFGPIGVGWGYHNGPPIWQEGLVVVPVTVWHGNRDTTFGPVYGAAEWNAKGRIDSDAPKKAATDGLTKALSHLGFNADVFLGLFDDNKYVSEVAAQFDPSTQLLTQFEEEIQQATSLALLDKVIKALGDKVKDLPKSPAKMKAMQKYTERKALLEADEMEPAE